MVVQADIFCASASEATAAVNQLKSDVLSDAASLESAINSQFAADGLSQTVTVQAIMASPQVVLSPPPAQNPGRPPSSGMGVVIGAVAGGIALLLVAVCAFYFLRKKGKNGKEHRVEKV